MFTLFRGDLPPWPRVICHSANMVLLSPTYADATLACAKPGSFSCIWTVMDEADAISRPIHSIYPRVNGTQDIAHRKLTVTFMPSSSFAGDTIQLLWTKYGSQQQRTWTPNHFVPVAKDKVSTDADTTLKINGHVPLFPKTPGRASLMAWISLWAERNLFHHACCYLYPFL